jgi:hypothetical protein
MYDAMWETFRPEDRSLRVPMKYLYVLITIMKTSKHTELNRHWLNFEIIMMMMMMFIIIIIVIIIVIIIIITANRFLPSGSVTTIRHNTQIHISHKMGKWLNEWMDECGMGLNQPMHCDHQWSMLYVQSVQPPNNHIFCQSVVSCFKGHPGSQWVL